MCHGILNKGFGDSPGQGGLQKKVFLGSCCRAGTNRIKSEFSKSAREEEYSWQKEQHLPGHEKVA